MIVNQRSVVLPGRRKALLLACVIGVSVLTLGGEVLAHWHRMSRSPAPAAPAAQIPIPQLLTEINRQLDPKTCGFLNNQRVEMMKTQLAGSLAPPERLNTELMYAEELMNSGKAEEAANEYKALEAKIRSTAPQMWDEAGSTVLVREAVACLRTGELQNCCDRNNPNSCLLPIRGSGVHTRQEGSRKAIACLLRSLQMQPDDLSARWLLNIAYMTVGEYPQKVPAKWLIPLQTYGGSATMPKFPNVAPLMGLDFQGWAGSVTMEDFRGNGLLDLVISSFHREGQLRYFRNNRNGTFTDVSKQAGLNKVIEGMGLNFGDLDNDGWLDFYAGTGNPDLGMLIPNRMFHNRAGKGFEEVTTSGDFGHLQKGHGVAFGDLNNNGQQDVFLVAGGAYEGDTAHDCFYLNPGNKNHWVTMQLTGVQSNRVAIGSEICVTVATPHGDRQIIRTVSTGASFGNNPLRQEFGLGNATAIKQVAIHWPATGKMQIVNGLRMDRFYKIREGDTKAEEWNVPKFKLSFDTHEFSPGSGVNPVTVR